MIVLFCNMCVCVCVCVHSIDSMCVQVSRVGSAVTEPGGN